MRVLLDTHSLLWALLSPRKLSVRAREALENVSTEVLVSAASAWEISTKYRLGRLREASAVVADYSGALDRLMARELPVTSMHGMLAGSFPQLHRDPFDRMLAAQSILESVPLVSNDAALKAFPVTLLW